MELEKTNKRRKMIIVGVIVLSGAIYYGLGWPVPADSSCAPQQKEAPTKSAEK